MRLFTSQVPLNDWEVSWLCIIDKWNANNRSESRIGYGGTAPQCTGSKYTPP